MSEEEPKFSKGTTARSKIALLQEEERIEAIFREKCEESYLCFVRGLTIASQTGPRVFENCMADFQRDVFLEMSPSLEKLRDGKMPEKRRWWLERTKKAGKDSDLATVALWLLAFPTRPFYIQIGAGDKTQAGIVKERMTHLLHWNPWLTDYVQIVKWEARSTRTLADGSPMCRLDIMSSDISGAHGGTPDLLIVNELTHVNKWEFVENLLDNADGVAQGMVLIATNAGIKGTKAEVWRNNAITSDAWTVHVWDRPAPWHSKKTVEDAAKRTSESRYKRLWWGKWASGKGNALNEEDIDDCFCLEGPEQGPQDGWIYMAGLDLGVSHDHAALMIIAVNINQQRIKTVWWNSWEPVKGVNNGEVDLIEVEQTTAEMTRRFRCVSVMYDPSQAKLMAQRLMRKGYPMREVKFMPANLTRMATCLVQVVEAHKLMCYDDHSGRLRNDFGKFTIVEMSYGVRLDAVRDETGHADVGTALVIVLPAAVDLLDGSMQWSSEDDVTLLDEDDLSEEEVDTMPQELKDIYTMDFD